MSTVAASVTIQPIVEGHGDVQALPVLLRRLAAEAQAWDVRVGVPIRRPRGRLVQQAHLQDAVRLALLDPKCAAVLVVLDGDTDCPAELGPLLREWASSASGNVPCEVVMPHREYEAWFLAAIESLRGVRGVRQDAQSHPNPEAPYGAKELLEKRMVSNRSYVETADQPAFSEQFSMSAAYVRCRSFRKLTAAFGVLLRATGREAHPWPPRAWTE